MYKEVILVGAGIVNMMTCYYLMREGYRVIVVDRFGDPRLGGSFEGFGCTSGGEDARIFTLRESFEDYEKVIEEGRLKCGIEEGGWLGCEGGDFSEEDWVWLLNFGGGVSGGMGFWEGMMGMNRLSGELWSNFFRENGELREGADFREGILKLYCSEGSFEGGVEKEEKTGGLIRVLEGSELLKEYGWLEGKVGSGGVIGGIEVEGFSVRVHGLMKDLIGILELGGVDFIWGEEVTGIRYNGGGEVEGIEVCGEVLRGGNYVFSLGAYGGKLLGELGLGGHIGGVFGVWLSLVNEGGLVEVSTKLELGGDFGMDFINIVASSVGDGEGVLRIGGGFGYIGSHFQNIVVAKKEELFEKLERVVEYFFREEYEKTRRLGVLESGKKYCIRPWAVSGGLFEVLRGEGGGIVVVTGGNNTGGFSQAPVIGEAVVSALCGEEHGLQSLYSMNCAVNILEGVDMEGVDMEGVDMEEGV